MVADPIFFRDLAYVFVAAGLGALLARVTHQPLILGYVLGGLLISPLTPGPSVSDLHTFELFAAIDRRPGRSPCSALRAPPTLERLVGYKLSLKNVLVATV
jgi:hypothetical protein